MPPQIVLPVFQTGDAQAAGIKSKTTPIEAIKKLANL
jgi:hypothetical protein